MTTAFWEGALAGYGIAIPVGAIAVLILEAGMRRGFRVGLAAGAGAASADLLYAALAALAGQVLASALTPFAPELRRASAVVLVALGGWGLWRTFGRRQAAASQSAATNGAGRTYLQFLGLTLLNPMTITYFAALILGQGDRILITSGDRAAFVMGAGLASLSWQTLLAGLGAVAHRGLPPRAQRLTSVIGNLVVIGLGVRLLF
jgi:arginine exporter protein ArgO